MPVLTVLKGAAAAVSTSNLLNKGKDLLSNLQEKTASQTQTKGSDSAVKLGDSSNTSDQNLVPLVRTQDITNDDVEIIDADWISSRFMVPDEDLSKLDANNRYFSTTRWKYYDTSLGGHIAINPKPQYTRYADIRQPRGLHDKYPDVTLEESCIPTYLRSSGKGFTLGRFYSESIDDFATTVFITFGRAKFNSLLSYLTRCVNAVDIHIANTGRPPSFWYGAGEVAGWIAAALMFPALSTIIWAIKLGNAFLNVGASSYDFYYLEESMKDYWYCVNSLLTNLATEMGLIGGTFNDDSTAERIGITKTYDKIDILGLSEVMGENIIDPESGWIDIFSIVTRVQRVYNSAKWIEYDNWTEDMEKNFTGYVQDLHATRTGQKAVRSFANLVDKYLSFSNWKNKANKSGFYDQGTDGQTTMELWRQDTTTKDGVSTTTETKLSDVNISVNKDQVGTASQTEALKNAKQNDTGFAPDTFKTSDGKNVPGYKSGKFLLDTGADTVNKDSIQDYAFSEPGDFATGEDGWGTKWAQTVDAITRDGALFAIFNVDYQGAVSESVSNSVSDMALKDTIKSVAKGVREVKFNLAGGNVLGDLQKSITDGISDFLKGGAAGITIGISNIVAGLMGGAYVDIPKKWDDSEISFPQVSYKMKLISPYGNVLSQFMDIYIPLCMLLAGALPQAAGRRSYTSPFLCSIFNRGIQKINLGMITSLTIERGTSNLAFDRQKRPLAIDVSFTVTDFSNLATSPMGQGVFTDFLNFETDDNSPLQRYLNVLAGRDLWTYEYMIPKIKNLLAKKRKELKAILNPNQWAFRVGDTFRSIVGPLQARRYVGITNTSNNNLRSTAQ